MTPNERIILRTEDLCQRIIRKIKVNHPDIPMLRYEHEAIKEQEAEIEKYGRIV